MTRVPWSVSGCVRPLRLLFRNPSRDSIFGAQPLRALHVSMLPVRTPYRCDGALLFSFSVKSGQRVLVSGGNGVGKTSLLRTISGLWAPATGTVAFNASVRVMCAREVAPPLSVPVWLM